MASSGPSCYNTRPMPKSPVNSRHRVEKDSMGAKDVPADAYYGVQTVRALENFPISGRRFYPPIREALGLVKWAAAKANLTVKALAPKLGRAILQATEEFLENRRGLQDQIVVDIYQAGAGTSLNMNVNEVLANRANEILGRPRGAYKPVHPNDHVNMAQSTNDVIPAAIRLSALLTLPRLLAALDQLAAAFEAKAHVFDPIVKSGRTHLQDAVPVRLGQEFGGYARVVAKQRARLVAARDGLYELNLGATAAGTGLNAHPRYKVAVAKHLAQRTGLPVRPATDFFEVTQSLGDIVAVSSALRGACLELIKIANDLRLLSSGPRTGLAEINLPPVQPGSSIMPGKVNPVMAEMLTQVCFQVIGCDTTIAFSAQAGQLELNVMMPVVAHNLIHSITILTNALAAFTTKCVRGITADAERCRDYANHSVGLATALNPYLGYGQAATLVKEAVATGKSIRAIMEDRGLTKDARIAHLLDNPFALTGPKRQKATKTNKGSV